MKNIILLMMVLMVSSCKPKQVIHDQTRTTIDSTAIATMKDSLQIQVQENERVSTEWEKSKQEVSKLKTEMLMHTINYYTAGEVNNETGKYPIASETITTNKSVLETTLRESETKLLEYEREVNTLMQSNRNLEYRLEATTEQVRELKSKTVPSFNLQSFLWGMGAGAILLMALLLFLKMR